MNCIHSATLCIISFNRKLNNKKCINRSVNLALHFLFIPFINAIFYSFAPFCAFTLLFSILLYLSRSSLHPHKTKYMFIYNSNFYLYYSFEKINAEKREIISTAQLDGCVWIRIFSILCVHIWLCILAIINSVSGDCYSHRRILTEKPTIQPTVCLCVPLCASERLSCAVLMYSQSKIAV